MVYAQTSKYNFEDLYIPEPNTGCYLWVGNMNGSYGFYGYEGAHIVAYKQFTNDYNTKGFIFHHKCEVKSCVNGAHIEKITKGQHNTLHKTKRYCKNGHPLFGANLKIDGNGGKRCRICRAEYNRLYAEKRK